MRQFLINYKKLVVLLLPSMMRKPFIVVLLQIATIAIRLRHSDFLTNRSSNLYRLNHTGQVCYLRALLNDAFSTRSCDFTITDGNTVSEWRYALDEMQHPYDQLMVMEEGSASMVELWNEEHILMETTPFTVSCPPEVFSDLDSMNRVKNIVNTYKLMAKRPEYISL